MSARAHRRRCVEDIDDLLRRQPVSFLGDERGAENQDERELVNAVHDFSDER